MESNPMDLQSTYNFHSLESQNMLNASNQKPVEYHQNLDISNGYSNETQTLKEDSNINSETTHRTPNKPKIKLYLIAAQNKFGPELYICPICRKHFSQSCYLVRHLQYVHRIEREPEVACPDCNKIFSSQRYLQAHMDRVHKGLVPSVQCDICGKVLKGQLEVHKISAHTKKFDIYCDICGKGFLTESKLKSHKIEKHEERQLLKCPEDDCGKLFRGRLGLKYHLDAVHPKNTQTLVCPECGKTFQHPYLYQRHVRAHKKPLTYPCTICDKILTSSGSLVHHIRSHTGEKPFICEHCGRGFSAKKLLKVHSVVHTKEKPHKCNECDQRFTQRGPLTRHMRKFHPELTL